MTDITKALDEIERHAISLDTFSKFEDIGDGKMVIRSSRRNSMACQRTLKLTAIARAADALIDYSSPVDEIAQREAALRAALDALAGGADAGA